MGETIGEKIVRLEENFKNMEKDLKEFADARKARATREWAVIMSGLGLVGTIMVKALGWL